MLAADVHADACTLEWELGFSIENVELEVLRFAGKRGCFAV